MRALGPLGGHRFFEAVAAHQPVMRHELVELAVAFESIGIGAVITGCRDLGYDLEGHKSDLNLLPNFPVLVGVADHGGLQFHLE